MSKDKSNFNKPNFSANKQQQNQQGQQQQKQQVRPDKGFEKKGTPGSDQQHGWSKPSMGTPGQGQNIGKGHLPGQQDRDKK